MGWTAGSDVSTGDLITAANWNNYLGASGSVDYLYDRWITWLTSSVNVLTDSNRTSDQTWTDLDLTASTSATADFAILRLKLLMDSITPAAITYLSVRKDGTTPSYYPSIVLASHNGDIAGAAPEAVVFVGMATGQVIEYQIDITGTMQVDSYIDVLGYTG